MSNLISKPLYIPAGKKCLNINRHSLHSFLYFYFFSNLGKCRINNTTWDVTIQVLSDTLLHNLWASNSFKTVVHLTPLSIFSLALSIGSCKKKNKKSNSWVRLQIRSQSVKNSVVKIGIPWFLAQTKITLQLKHWPQYWSSFNDRRHSSYPICS